MLHNMMLGMETFEEACKWIEEDDDDLSDVNADDELNCALPNDAPGKARHEQLLMYMLERNY